MTETQNTPTPDPTVHSAHQVHNVHSVHPPKQPAIEGDTRVVGVMGWPIAHTLSPPMHNAAYAAGGQNLVYVPFPVHPDRVAEAVRGLRALGMLGANVTIPHKQAVAARMDELTPEARACGAVNTIEVRDDGRLVGHSTDGFGFIKSLEVDGGFFAKDRIATLIGAGGVGRAMAVALVRAGVRLITILNRTESRRVELAQLLEGLEGAHPELVVAHAAPGTDAAVEAVLAADIVANATSLGMKPDDPPPVDPGAIHPHQFVYDTIYVPAETRLLREARARGAQTLGGLGMLAYQGARAIEIWTGQWPDADLMKRVLAEKLGLG